MFKGFGVQGLKIIDMDEIHVYVLVGYKWGFKNLQKNTKPNGSLTCTYNLNT